MRSTNKSAAARLLIIIGRGLAAGFATDLVWQLQQGGFETRIAFTPEADGWAAPEPYRVLSGVPVFFTEPHPLWVDKSEPFAATVAVGLSTGLLADIANGAGHSPAIDLFLKRGGPLLVLHEPFPAEAEPIVRACASRGHILRELPAVPGQWRAAFEQTFADLVLFLSRRRQLETMPVVVSRTIPEQLSALAGDPPAWKAELERHLRRLGFPKPTDSLNDAAPLLIETYEGPFPVRSKKARGSTLTVTLDLSEADQTPATQARGIRVRFAHPDAPEAAVRSAVESGWLIVRRQPHGHLLVTDSTGDRLLPNVTAQPAFSRLAELLADRLAHSAG